jgi:ParB/RepB/Spo0J family partition protein
MSGEKTFKILIADIEWSENVRSGRSPERIEELAASLKRHGQLVPIRVRRVGDVMYGIDGNGRCQAAISLGWTEITALIDDKKLSKADVIAQQLVTNCQRDDLPVSDKGRSVEMLMTLRNQTMSEVAAEMGFSVATVSRWLSGHRLPESLRDRVERGELGLTTALEIAKTCKPEDFEEAAKAAAKGKLTRDVLVGRRKRVQAAKPEAMKIGSRFTATLGPGRSVSVTGVTELDSVIEVLEDLLGRARRARTKGHSAGTFSKMLRDEAKLGGSNTSEVRARMNGGHAP